VEGSRVVESEQRWAHSWARATILTAGIVLAFTVMFAVVPDRLATLIEQRTRSSIIRDLTLTAWSVGSVIAACWVLVWLQRRRIM